MIKLGPISVSLYDNQDNLKLSLIRGQKYIRGIKQSSKKEPMSKISISLFSKKMKTIKTLKRFELQFKNDCGSKGQLHMIQHALKSHSQHLTGLDISTLYYSTSNENHFLFPMKSLSKVSITNDLLHVNNLAALRKLESLSIEVKNEQMENYLFLYKKLTRLTKIQNIDLVVAHRCLNNVLCVLNQYAVVFQRQVNFQLVVKDESELEELPALSNDMLQRVTELNIQCLDSEAILYRLFSGQNFGLLNLRSLSLKFDVPDLGLISYLKHLRQVMFLEKLSLSFLECWETEFIEGILSYLDLPAMLQDFKLDMPISFQNTLSNQILTMIEKENTDDTKYPWRYTNLFEQDLLFVSFFDKLKQAPFLKKIKFVFQTIEGFNSHYTNFFVSILNRLPNLSSFHIQMKSYILDEESPNSKTHGGYFDLSLLFQACSRMSQLEDIKVIMPNLLFEDADIDYKMSHLKSFKIGIAENEKEEIIKFQNISRDITKWLKRLLSIAPNLRSLNLDFVEVTDEQTFYKRFMFIERFRQLEKFSSRFIVQKCSLDGVYQVGKMIKSLQKLNILALQFFESDRNILELKKYLNYCKCLKEHVLAFFQREDRTKNDE